MKKIRISDLITIVQRILQGAGVNAEESLLVARSLVSSNIMGHDSHGVVRVAQYVPWIKEGSIQLGKELTLVKEADASALVDGQWGFGQSICHQATQLVCEKARQRSVGVVELFNCSHIGRLGEYVEVMAEKNMIGLVTCNNHGGGILQAPFGGIDARMSPNPIAVGVPTGGEFPIVVDMTSSVVAEGKIRMKRNLGEHLPDGWALNSNGDPITNPNEFYGPPMGAILPFGGSSAHKGFALSIVVEVLSGALGGGGYSGTKKAPRGKNGVFLMAIDIAAFLDPKDFNEQTTEFINWLKSSRLMAGFDEIIVPGELEYRNRKSKEISGIEIDNETWNQLIETGTDLGVKIS